MRGLAGNTRGSIAVAVAVPSTILASSAIGFLPWCVQIRDHIGEVQSGPPLIHPSGTDCSSRFRALACDYDGTLAHDGRLEPRTIDALRELRASGRDVILVTG